MATVWAQGEPAQTVSTKFRPGERLTYDVSFEKYRNAAYVEMAVVSRGALDGHDAVELRSRLKTLDLFSSAFAGIDETRVIYASNDSGLPLYISKTTNNSVLPKTVVTNYLTTPTINFDLVTLIYRIRSAGGVGAFAFSENGQIYNAVLTQAGSTKLSVRAGEFSVAWSTVESDYLKELGITDLRIGFSEDEYRLPVAVYFRTTKGQMKAELASVQVKDPKIVAIGPETIPTPLPTPRPSPTQRPIPTPTPYIANQPLSPDLAFELGETLDYRISANGQPQATLRLRAKERSQLQSMDTLLLSAEIISTEPGNSQFARGDSVTARVDPDTLAPYVIEFSFRGQLAFLNQTARFDQDAGSVEYGSSDRVDAPVGTHSILSLFYALRSFNLKRSKDTLNPVNDTRVSVFWLNRSYIFTLRPSDAGLIDIGGAKVSAQLISIITGEPQLDQLGVKIWLSNESKRVPLRICVGNFQADLISHTTIQPK